MFWDIFLASVFSLLLEVKSSRATRDALSELLVPQATNVQASRQHAPLYHYIRVTFVLFSMCKRVTSLVFP